MSTRECLCLLRFVEALELFRELVQEDQAAVLRIMSSLREKADAEHASVAAASHRQGQPTSYEIALPAVTFPHRSGHKQD